MPWHQWHFTRQPAQDPRPTGLDLPKRHLGHPLAEVACHNPADHRRSQQTAGGPDQLRHFLKRIGNDRVTPCGDVHVTKVPRQKIHRPTARGLGASQLQIIARDDLPGIGNDLGRSPKEPAREPICA